MKLPENALWHGEKLYNKPRDHNNPFFKEMTASRARFKLAMRFIKRHEDQLRQDAIANALL